MSQSGPPALDRLSAESRTVLALAVVTLVALAVRLYDLGGRVFHWDEGRVGYWTLRYAETGQFEYAPIIHGPFLRIVNAAVFGVLPPTDFAARLVVALVGGLLPLSAWLFREHLDRVEVVTLAVLLACNPLLVYYSRFMRNDVLVGGFALFALGFAVRAIDARDVRRLYPASVLFALSSSTKANALLYLLCFLGAAAIVVDHRLVRAARARGTSHAADGSGHAADVADRPGTPATLRGVASDWGRALRRELDVAAGARRPIAFAAIHLAGLAATFLAVIVFFYAPRPALYLALDTPGAWPDVVAEATVGSASELFELWIAGDMQANPYLTYLGHDLETLAHAAAVVVAFAVVGFVVDGYARGSERVPAGRNRAFIAFASYWGLASVVGYPAATDINAPWSAVHIVLPLTVPAAVGLAFVVREGWTAVTTPDGTVSLDAAVADRETAVLVGAIVLVATAGVVGPTVAYWNSTDPDHTAAVQWAQPHNDARGTLDDVEAVAAHHDGDVDVLFVGSDTSSRTGAFYVENESAADDQGAPGGWYDRLPLPWYYERAGATVDSVSADADAETALADAPPVVIVHEDRRANVEPHLEGYRATEHELRLWGFNVVFFVDESALEAARDDARD